MFMYYTVCYFTGIFYAFVRQISMLFTDNKDFVFFMAACVRSIAQLLSPGIIMLNAQRDSIQFIRDGGELEGGGIPLQRYACSS